MNVFVLCTGRCGSVTFVKACEHLTNFSTAHESRRRLIGASRLQYPENHIEADNRLSWFLGRLDREYGDRAMYVHLTRQTHPTAVSFSMRFPRGIIGAYQTAVLGGGLDECDPVELSTDYCDTVNSNIKLFLRDKTHKMDFTLENAKADFEKFWAWVKAEGDLQAALGEWDVKHNANRDRKRDHKHRIPGAKWVKQAIAGVMRSPAHAHKD